MAFHPRANCKTCMAIMAESPDDPSKSKLFGLVNKVLVGTLKMTVVQREYPEAIPNYQGFRNHCIKHQSTTETQLTKARVRKTNRKMQHELLEKKLHHTERRSNVMEWLQDQIENGNVKPTASALVALLKQEADIEAKQTDQAIEMQKLFNNFIANPLTTASLDAVDRHARNRIQEGEVVEADTTPGA